ncbi:hypothetical protein QV06_10305 [Gallibacterium genomosp. 3]|uniref:DUF302 domain-containing protein n=1 Tax=Gallibacterium genomosp. 3 TaxID=505345 RepID=A0A1A7PMV8_9PAST|nr:DUF302 domain-containing protein [Gallibacterium genomosp. 3]OBX03091.1 hypothetical protein QV06_10305 [Gallibacterium genomosp. 3]
MRKLVKYATLAMLINVAFAAQADMKPVTDVLPSHIHYVESKYSFDNTIERLVNNFKQRGMTIFAIIDHQKAAKETQLEMQPATVIVFGTPKAGTPLMLKDPDFALQLPLKVLVTEVNGKVRVVFNDTKALISGSKISFEQVENSLAKVEGLIQKVVTE